ncbi:MAG: Uncharacterized protein FD127_1812 [Acidimicrobiaceae bacterium]|nr:MAG: Uncharacterized protein FD127_1812 [Acidimicrobiaceae bacterium]
MRVTIDRVGRVVIPKSLRLATGIEPNSELEVVADGAGLRLEPVARHRRTIETVQGLPRLRAVSGQTISDHDVAELRGNDQR